MIKYLNEMQEGLNQVSLTADELISHVRNNEKTIAYKCSSSSQLWQYDYNADVFWCMASMLMRSIKRDGEFIVTPSMYQLILSQSARDKGVLIGGNSFHGVPIRVVVNE